MAPIWSPLGVGSALAGPIWSTAFAPIWRPAVGRSLPAPALIPGGSLDPLVMVADWSIKEDFCPPASFVIFASVRYVGLEPVTSWFKKKSSVRYFD